MRKALLTVLLLAPVAAHAAGALDRLGAWARSSAVNPLTAAASPMTPPYKAAAISGEGSVSGHVNFTCPDSGWGPMRGTVHLTGSVKMQGPNGLSGEIPVVGYAFLNGSCRAGEASVTDTLKVTGKGPLRESDGTIRQVEVEGKVPLEFHTTSDVVWLRAYLYVTGR